VPVAPAATCRAFPVCVAHGEPLLPRDFVPLIVRRSFFPTGVPSSAGAGRASSMRFADPLANHRVGVGAGASAHRMV
jgi:hypothetical protein